MLIARIQRIQQMRRFPRRLHHDADGAALRIGILDGDRNPLAFLVNTKDDELSRFLFAGDAGSFQDEPFNARGDELCVNDLEHVLSIQKMTL